MFISVPGKKPPGRKSWAELLDLYPTVSSLCGLEVSARLQGKDISPMLDDPTHKVRDTAFCVNGRGFLLRDDKWACIQYRENASAGIELFDIEKDPNQYTNLANKPGYEKIVASFKNKLAAKLKAVRDNDLGRN